MNIKKESESIAEIDKNHLDRECIRLPSDYRRFAFLSADAKADVQEAKASLDVLQAELARAVRLDPDKYGLDKVTESALNAVVITQLGYIEAQKELFEAQHNHDICQAVVWALEHKKRALTLLVELHGLGYFADVKVSAEGQKAVEDMVQRKVRRKHQDNDDE